MSIYVTQIGKHKFVCGLFWQSLSRPRELMKEASNLAKKIDSDLVVLRKDHTTVQAGFASSSEGARRSMLSLGAVVSKTVVLEGAYYDGEQQQAHNWLGAFKLPDGKWAYFAVRDASFLPNGDFAGTKEEVLERLQGDYGLGGWNVVFGDEELADYGFHNFNAKRIESLIPHKKNGTIRLHSWWRLRQIETKKPWLLTVAIGALAVLIAISGLAYWQHHKRKAEEKRRELAIEAARQKMLRGAALSALPHPWASKPLPRPTAQACLDRLSHLTPGGWQLEEYVCTASKATYSWSRRNSTIAFLLARVPEATIDPSGDKASHTEPLSHGPGKDEALLDQQALLNSVVSQLQLVAMAPSITKAQSPPRAPQDNLPEENWQTYSFSLSTRGLAPTRVVTILDRPGVRIDKLTYRQGEWSIEGAMYVK